MTTKPKPIENYGDLDEFVSDPDTTATPKKRREVPQWSGRPTKITLARPITRDGQVVGPESACLDCARAGTQDESHQFHVLATRTKDGWVGPDARHIEDLIGTVTYERDNNGNVVRTHIRGAYIAGTEVHRQYVQERRRVVDLIGPEAALELDTDGLAETMKFELLPDRRTINPGIERDLRKNEMATVTELVAVIRDKLVAGPEQK
jgi:hypothetical protein